MTRARRQTSRDIDRALWLQADAATLYRYAAIYRDRDRPGDAWLASKVQENAAHSARLARQRLGIEP